MLKPYMGYSREGGTVEGAVLIFAHNVKEAKRIAWPEISSFFTDEFTDMAVTLIKDGSFLSEQVAQWSKDKIAKDEPHVVDSPPSCKVCELWGNELNEVGLCEGKGKLSELTLTRGELEKRRSGRVGKYSRDKGKRGELDLKKKLGGSAKRVGISYLATPVDVESDFAVYQVKNYTVGGSLIADYLARLAALAPTKNHYVSFKVKGKWYIAETLEQHTGDHGETPSLKD